MAILLIKQRFQDPARNDILPNRIDITFLRQRPLILQTHDAVVKGMGIIRPDGDTVDLQIRMEVLERFAAGGGDDEDGCFGAMGVDGCDEDGVAEDACWVGA